MQEDIMMRTLQKGRMVQKEANIKGRDDGHVREVVTLMEGKWSCYRGGQFREGEWSCYSGGQFNGGRMVLKEVASISYLEISSS